MEFEKHKEAMKRLRRLGVGGYVVMTAEARAAGVNTRFPIGEIVSLEAPISVRVRRLGQSTVSGYAAGFWQPAPNRLINHLRP